MTDSLKNLKDLIDILELPMKELGFSFTYNYDSISSGGSFTNGFFSDDKIKIGFIFRGDKFGSVNYETSYSNISHDMIIEFLDKSNEQKLNFYNGGNFGGIRNSKSQNIIKIGEAFLDDFSHFILPYIRSNSIDDINKMIKTQRKKWMIKKTEHNK